MESLSQQEFYELSFYTLALRDSAFIHQHSVDAYTAQTAGKGVKDIAVCFALAGLYLHIEKGYTGREVQQAHMYLAKHKKPWPVFDLPEQRGNITVSTILSYAPGAERNEMIHEWAREVWDCFRGSHDRIISFLETYPDLKQR